MDTQRLILFIVLSFSILMLWDAWQKEQHPAPLPTTTKQSTVVVPVTEQEKPLAINRSVAPSSLFAEPGKEIKISTDEVVAVINTRGGDLTHLALRKYKDKRDTKKNFVLLDVDPPRYYVAQSGLIGGDLPTHKSLYTAETTKYTLTPGSKVLTVALRWAGSHGITVIKTYTFHRGSYVIDQRYTIKNASQTAITPSAYFQLLRDDKPPRYNPRFIHTYTGVAIYTSAGRFQKISFKDISEGKHDFVKNSSNGWVAILQHYFLSAWLPAKGIEREYYTKHIGSDLYTAGVLLENPFGTIKPGEEKTLAVPLYVGPQEQDSLNKLAKGLDLTVDYGWLTIIASPIYWVLAQIYKLVGNWGFAIIILTILIKLAFFPLSAKSYRSMAQMRKLSPKLKQLKEKYGDDRQRQHQAMMAIYKTEKINPLSGCLPVVVQIPVFIALYWVLLSTVEMREAPFILWIHDLSAPDPYYVLPIIMGITQFIQTRLNPTPPDPVQAKLMMIMPLAFTIFFVFFPAGLVLYWIASNTLSILQQWYITRKLGARTAH